MKNLFTSLILGAVSLITVFILLGLTGTTTNGYDYRKNFFAQHWPVSLLLILIPVVLAITALIINAGWGRVPGIILSLISILFSLVLFVGAFIGG